MIHQIRPWTAGNIVTNVVDYKSIAYTIDPVHGGVGFAEQTIMPPESPRTGKMQGAFGPGLGGSHKSVKVNEQATKARGVPIFDYVTATRIFDCSETKKISLARAAFEIVGEAKFLGEVVQKFKTEKPHHMTAMPEPVTETSPAQAVAPKGVKCKID